ncbi:hypothetical protein F4680DRAFT_14689 [Xylaria scruposa]|nr:hypothetical protein F4680DRAFT_14689 [Xylaria scruposa]
MFTLPEAKRVCRKDLDDSASASTSSGEEEEVGHDAEAELALRAKLNAQLSGLLDFSFKVEPRVQQHEAGQPKDQLQGQAPNVTSDVQQEDENPEEGEEAFAFRLFRDEALTHTVVLTNDEDPTALGDGGFVVPSRPRSYYIASPPSPEKVSDYRSVAVSAEYVLTDAKRRRWGLEKPWRVIHITPNSSSVSPKTVPRSAQEGDSAEKKKAKRTRPGKKHRILLRVREKVAREREEAAKKSILEKEQHLQEKKKRLNRERKLKRRQKEREKKAEAQGTNPDGGRAHNSPEKDVEDRASVPGDD